jgi:putative lipoprotein
MKINYVSLGDLLLGRPMLKVELSLSLCLLTSWTLQLPAAEAPDPSEAAVTATVTYRERVALPATASVRVRLLDVSRADAPAAVLAEQAIDTDGRQVPFRFEIPYDPDVIDPRFTYAVQARIENEGKLLFITDSHYPVITRGAPKHVDLLLRAVGDR